MATVVFGQKCGNGGNGLHMFESMWHVLVNVTIVWGICTAVHMHFTYKHQCVGNLIWKWKSVKCNAIILQDNAIAHSADTVKNVLQCWE
jgi:hypothetical protein